MAFSRQQLEFKTVPQMQLMHQAGLILSRALDAAVEAAVPGVTTADVDAVFARVLQEAGATPNFLGYYGYPATICASVKKTGRAVVLEDDWLTYGVGAEIAATIQEGAFDYLDAPVRRVAAAEVPLPYAKSLERIALPDADALIRVINEQLDATGFAR